MHAGRPDESVVSKISRWMLLNVGSRFGVGPVSDDRASSQAVVPANTAAAMTRYNTRKRIDSPWGWGVSSGEQVDLPAAAGGAASLATTTSMPFMSS